MIKELKYTALDAPYSYITYTYDASNRLIEWVDYNADDTIDDGFLVEYGDSSRIERITFTDSAGNEGNYYILSYEEETGSIPVTYYTDIIYPFAWMINNL